jgi:hypothetical protein
MVPRRLAEEKRSRVQGTPVASGQTADVALEMEMVEVKL